uniref:Uncharacterized protein n=1 Tax=Arundo donax TaxID=35708 RepID=A0A0A8YCX4_ARUDO
MAQVLVDGYRIYRMSVTLTFTKTTSWWRVCSCTG